MSPLDPVPSETPNQPDEPAPPSEPGGRSWPRGRSGRRTLTGAAGALVLTVGLAGVALARTAAVEGPAATQRSAETDPAGAQAGQRSDLDDAELRDLTLGQLSDELERLGHEVHVGPDHDSTADGGLGQDLEVDPFEGLTEAEIDAMSDEEFFDRLEAAGLEGEWLDDGFENDDHTGGGNDDGGGQDDDQDSTEGVDEEPLATVPVDGDRIDTSGLSSEVAEQATAIWERFAELIPADQRQMVANFELMGRDYEGAHVYPTTHDPTKWNLGVGLGLGDDLDYVLIHEFGHLLTLQAEEVPPSEGDGSCPTYHTGEGCALQGSTVAQFVQRFWPQAMQDELARIEEIADEDEYHEAVDAFYQQRKDQFVTDYAASNPGEDLAETFATFVTEDRPTGDTIADRKVRLLWSDSSMVELREQIRAAR